MSDIQLTVGLTADDVTKKADELKNRIESIFAEADNMDVSTSFMSLQTSMAKAYQSSVDLQAKMEKLANTKTPTEEYTALENKLKDLEAEYTKLAEKMVEMENLGIGHGDSTYDNTLSQMDAINEKQWQLMQQMEEMEQAGTAFIPGTETEQYDTLTQKLAGVNNQMSVYVRKSEEAGVAGETMQLPTTKWEAFKMVVQKVGSALNTIVSKSLNAVGSKLATGFTVAAKAAGRLLTQVNKLASPVIKKGISRLASSIFGLKRNTDDTSKSVKKGIKLFIRYAFGVRSFFFLYRRIRKAVVEGFENMAQFSGPLNDKISQIITSFNYLKSALTTAFAPIVNFVAPAVSLLLDKLAQATTAVGKFFAALLGQTSFVQAKKVYKDYAKSLDKNSKSQQKNATKTQKKVEKLQRTIAGFDDVEILKGPDDNDTGSSSSPGTGGLDDALNPWEDPKKMFETVGIEAKFKELADKIKGFFKNKDWEGLGAFIASGINSAFRKIDDVITSSDLQNKVKTVVDGITGTFNSLVDHIDWPLIGKTFGDGINLIIDTLNRLLTGIDWVNLGTKIAEGLNSLVDTVNWTAIGNYFANKFNAIIGTFYGAITNFDWADLGVALGDAINGFFLQVDWNRLALTLAGFINGVFDTLQTAIDTVKWDEIALKLGEAINTFISEVDWEKAGKTLSTLFKNLLDYLFTVIETVDWQKFGEKIGEFLASVDWIGIIVRLFKLLVEAMSATAQVIIGALGTIFKSAVASVKKWVKDKGAKDIVSGLLSGIVNALGAIGTWINDHFYKPIIEAIKKSFGISSPSKKMMEIGKYVIQGFFSGITDTLKNIGQWIKSNVVDKVIGALKTGFGIAGSIANGLKTIGSAIIGGIKSGASNAWTTLSTYLGKLKTNIFNLLNKGKWSSIGTNILKGIKSGISSGWRWLSTTVSNLATNLYNSARRALGIRSPSRVFRDKIGKMIPAGMAIGIDKSASSALKSAEQLASNVVDAATQAIQLPPIVGGQVIPYSVGKADTNDTNNALNQLLSMLQYNRGNDVTLDTLETLLVTMFRQYMNIQFYMGDEQVARHANAGNARLERRYNPSTM